MKSACLLFARLIPLVAALALSLAGCHRPHAPEWRPDPAQPLDAHAILDPSTLHIGERIHARLLVAHPSGAALTFDEPGGDGSLHVLHRTVSREEMGSDRTLTRYEYTLAALDPGMYPVFQHTLTASAPSGALWTLELEPSTIHVRSILTGDEQRADIREVRPFPGRGIPLSWIILAAVLLVAILAAVLTARHLRNRSATAVSPPQTPREPPHVRALRRLDALRRRGWIEEGRAEPFYVELSDILRQYLEERFALRAPEQTTEEFIQSASMDRRLTPEQRNLITAFMQQSDLVKFARHTPGPAAMNEALDAGERVIRETAADSPAEGSSP